MSCQFFFRFSEILTSESSLPQKNNTKQIFVMSFHYLQGLCFRRAFAISGSLVMTVINTNTAAIKVSQNTVNNADYSPCLASR